jgi:hypothetical protein
MAPATDYDGELIIYNKAEANGEYVKINCTIPFVTSTINFQNSNDCENDDAYAFRLVNVPSATFFTFYDDPNCSGSGNFTFRFKTVRHPTTMVKAMSIEEAGAGEVNQVVMPAGVLVISTQRSGDVGGKLSCVKIERSAAPTGSKKK